RPAGSGRGAAAPAPGCTPVHRRGRRGDRAPHPATRCADTRHPAGEGVLPHPAARFAGIQLLAGERVRSLPLPPEAGVLSPPLPVGEGWGEVVGGRGRATARG